MKFSIHVYQYIHRMEIRKIFQTWVIFPNPTRTFFILLKYCFVCTNFFYFLLFYSFVCINKTVFFINKSDYRILLLKYIADTNFRVSHVLSSKQDIAAFFAVTVLQVLFCKPARPKLIRKVTVVDK